MIKMITVMKPFEVPNDGPTSKRLWDKLAPVCQPCQNKQWNLFKKDNYRKWNTTPENQQYTTDRSKIDGGNVFSLTQPIGTKKTVYFGKLISVPTNCVW